jgi:NAD(P)H-hydrate epimerase
VGDAAVNLRAARGCGVEVVGLGEIGEEAVGGALEGFGAAVWIDALLGTGIERAVSGAFAAAIRWVNGCNARVLAVDVPSGVHGERGEVMGCAVRADVTATFAAVKLGCVVQPGRALCGEIVVMDIGVVDGLVEGVGTWLTPEWAAGRLGPRPRAMHKGSAGRVVVVGGSDEMTGALLLTARGAMEGGAGLVTAATRAEVVGRVALAVPEVMAAAGIGGEAEAARLAALVERTDVVIVGPGMGQEAAAARAVAQVLGSSARLVVDADALNVIAGAPALRAALAARGLPCVLTPHPGEMARLCGCSVGEVEREPVVLARRLAAELGAVVVLKLSTAVIAAPDGRLAVSGVGNPGMASAGMGDALSGLLGARLAELVDPFAAACAAVYHHGRAGDLAAERLGQRALTASGLLDAAPLALRELEGL